MNIKDVAEKLDKNAFDELRKCNDIEDAKRILNEKGIKESELLFDSNKRELSDDDLAEVNGGLDIAALIQMLIKYGFEKNK